MTDKPSIEELRAAAEKAAADLAAAEAEEAKVTPLSVEAASAKLAEAEALLKAAEGPYWDREHARFELATAETLRDELAQKAPHLLEAHEAIIPALRDAHKAAIAAHAAHVAGGVTQAHIDAAAQGVLDARTELERALAQGEG